MTNIWRIEFIYIRSRRCIEYFPLYTHGTFYLVLYYSFSLMIRSIWRYWEDRERGTGAA